MGVEFEVSDDEQRARLEVIANDGNSKLKHVKRARIILLADQGQGTMAIMAGTGTSKPMVWHWQRRTAGRRRSKRRRERRRARR